MISFSDKQKNMENNYTCSYLQNLNGREVEIVKQGLSLDEAHAVAEKVDFYMEIKERDLGRELSEEEFNALPRFRNIIVSTDEVYNQERQKLKI